MFLFLPSSASLSAVVPIYCFAPPYDSARGAAPHGGEGSFLSSLDSKKVSLSATSMEAYGFIVPSRWLVRVVVACNGFPYSLHDNLKKSFQTVLIVFFIHVVRPYEGFCRSGRKGRHNAVPIDGR